MCRRSLLRSWFYVALAALVVVFLGLAVAGPAFASTTDAYKLQQLTNNNYADDEPRVSGDMVVWSAIPADGTDDEIYVWTPGGGTVRVTNNDVSDTSPQVSGNRIVWLSYPADGTDSEVYTWSAGNLKRLTTDTVDQDQLQFQGGRAVWRATPVGKTKSEVFTWVPGSAVAQLTDNAEYDDEPHVDGNRVAWMHYGPNGYEIYTWTPLGGIHQITNNTFSDENPSVSGDRVAWAGIPSGSIHEIYTWSAASNLITRVTVNSWDDTVPRVSGNRIAWVGYPPTVSGGEIYTWDDRSGNTLRVTTDNQADQPPVISGSRIAWRGMVDGSGWKTFTWTLTWGTLLVDPSNYGDDYVGVSGERLVWRQLTAMGKEIFTATPYPAVKSVTASYGPATGGTAVSIYGTGFTGATAVKFGGTAATTFTVVSANQITATAPAHAYGTVNVTVTTPVGTSNTAGTGDDYTYWTWYQEDNSRLLYHGSWSPNLTSNASGGSYTTTGSGYVQIPFWGDSIRILATKGPNFGRMSFSVDNGLPGMIDLYALNTTWKADVFDAALTSGFHVLKLSYTGAKNPSSGGTTVNIDSVLVGGSLAGPALKEQDDTKIKYAGTWATTTSAGASGTTWAKGTAADSTVVIPFRGVQLDWIATKGASGGKAKVSVDGGAATIIDLHAATAEYQKNVFSTGVLSYGDHTLRITWDPTNAAGTYVSLDAVKVIGELMASTLTETTQTSTKMTWEGTWTYPTIADASGGSWARTDSSGAKVTFWLSGTKLDIIGTKAPHFGKLKITIDGKPPVYADLYADTIQWQKTVWSSGFIAPGMHPVTIEWSGQKNDLSSGTAVGIDALRSWGSILKSIIIA